MFSSGPDLFWNLSTTPSLFSSSWTGSSSCSTDCSCTSSSCCSPFCCCWSTCCCCPWCYWCWTCCSRFVWKGKVLMVNSNPRSIMDCKEIFLMQKLIFGTVHTNAQVLHIFILHFSGVIFKQTFLLCQSSKLYLVSPQKTGIGGF